MIILTKNGFNIKFEYIAGQENVSDILINILEPNVLQPLVQPYLFWSEPLVGVLKKKEYDDVTIKCIPE